MKSKRNGMGDCKMSIYQKLYPWQKKFVDSVKDKDSYGIFLDMGLGKTPISLALAEKNACTKVLIISINSKVIESQFIDGSWLWWASQSLIPYNFLEKHETSFDNASAELLLINYESLYKRQKTNNSIRQAAKTEIRDNIVDFIKSCKHHNVAIIIDESAKLKNPDAKLTQAFFELAPLFQKRVIMTGTPVANRPYDIWSQIYFLDQGESLGTDFNEFKRQTDLSNKLAHNEKMQESFEDVVSKINNKIKAFTVRETKNSGIIELPDKVYIRESAYFTQDQEALYDQICEELRVEVEKDGQIVEDDSSAFSASSIVFFISFIFAISSSIFVLLSFVR